MKPYVVEVEQATHDDLQEGTVAARQLPGPGRHGLDFVVVVIAATEVSSDAEACLLAAQLAHEVDSRMVTATRLVSWPH